MSTIQQEDSPSSTKHHLARMIGAGLIVVAVGFLVIVVRAWNTQPHRTARQPVFANPAIEAMATARPTISQAAPVTNPVAVAATLYQARRDAFCGSSASALAGIWEHTPLPVGIKLPAAANTPETYATDLALLQRSGGANVMCRDFLNPRVSYASYASSPNQIAVIVSGVGASANGRQLEVFDFVNGSWEINRIWSLPI